MSSDLAKWYHSMTFTYTSEWDAETKRHGTVNTWDDWHLIPTSRPVFQQGDVKTVYIDIPGADGQIDITESLSGYPTYENRQGTMEFIVANGYRASWAGGFSKFANWLHGKSLRCVLDDDPNYFYEGRFKLNEWKSNNNGTWSNITIDYNLKPYKYNIAMSTENWLWDPFNFETDVIYNGSDITVNGTTTFVVNNNEMHVVPTFVIRDTDDKKWTIELNGTVIDIDFDLSAVTSNKLEFKDPRLELLSGENTLKITAQTTGKLDVVFRGGSL